MGTSEITLHIVSITELLMSPGSVHRKKSLQHDAEDFIIEEAEDIPKSNKIKIIIHLPESETSYHNTIDSAIRTHFRYRQNQSRKKLKRVFHYGLRMLLIAIGLLAVIFLLIRISIHIIPDNALIIFINESFIILGWVALWRPLELLLYELYPIKKEVNLYYRLERCLVEVITGK